MLDEVFGKQTKKFIYGKYRAVVKNISDPEKLGRIKVKCPDIYGEDNSPWAWPCLPYGGFSELGMFFLPELESGVWIEFEQGNITNPIWVGCWWTKLRGTNEVPQNSQDKYGSHKMIKTKSGHSIEFYDEASNEKIIITDHSGSTVTMSANNIIINSIGNINLMTGSTEGVPLGTSLKVWLDDHIHSFSHTHTAPAGGGTTSGPSATTVDAVITKSPSPSTIVKVK